MTVAVFSGIIAVTCLLMVAYEAEGRAKLRAAVECGALWGVRIGAALFVVAVVLGAIADYARTREAAMQGARAFGFLQQRAQEAVAAQQQQPEAAAKR